jgi:hypothetical protein
MKKRIKKSKSPYHKMIRTRVHVIKKLLAHLALAQKTLLRKMGKDRVTKNRCQKGSKECAGNTCTPCEGAAPPSTLHRSITVKR